ncbi:transcriptional regulator AbrB (plasmid) [Calothrix sp. NIES-4071]|nr:transcriptional regulator AbrB [Calothrix sp. NIES-4071]BAZ64930.1 transcriptional regulator AbrB [Calothrix sp. NIES-4105]
MARKKITKSPEPKASAKKALTSKPSESEAPFSQKVKQIKSKVEEAPAKKAKKIEVLEGKALTDKVKEMPNSSKEEKAKACGYYSVTKDGVERVNMMKFLNALLDAEEISFDTPSDKNSRGRSASYRIAVQSNGSLLIGSTYTKQLGLKPGDEFSLKIGRMNIKLTAISEEENQDEIAA